MTFVSNDVALLTAWRERRDSVAMNELIRRHARFVYGAARRMLRDETAAQDVTQAVFLILIQKPPRNVRHEAQIASWLHQTARYACANARRLRARRSHHEHSAARSDLHLVDPSASAISSEEARMLPMLDEAIAQLGPRERDGVIGWYFQQRTFQQIGQQQGVSADAARKRVTRAVERMREFFEVRSVSTASTASISACLTAQASSEALAHSAATIAQSLSKLATVAHLADLKVGASTSAIMKGVVKSMLLTKLQSAAAAAVVLMAIGTGAAVTAKSASTRVAPQPLMLSTTTAAEQIVQLADGATLEIIGVSTAPATDKSWFGIDGTPIDGDPSGPFTRHKLPASRGSRQFLMHARGPTSVALDTQIPGATGVGNYVLDNAGEADQFWLIPFTPRDAHASTIDITVLVADGEWQRLCEAKSKPGEELGKVETKLGSVIFTRLIPGARGENKCEVYVALPTTIDQSLRFSVIDEDGQLHTCDNISNDSTGQANLTKCEFGVPLDRVASVVIDTRDYNKTVTLKNVSLQSGKTSKAEVQMAEKK